MTNEDSRRSLVIETFKLVGVIVEGGGAWTGEKIVSYFSVLKRLAILLGIASLCDMLVFSAAAIFNSQMFMTISLVAFGLMLMALLLFAAPLLVGIAGLAEMYPSLRLFINLQASIALFFLIIGLVISIFPVSGKNAMVIFVASMILSLIWFVTGTKPDLTFLKTKVVFLTALTIVVPVFAQQFPQISLMLQKSLREIDEEVPKILQITPKRIPVDSYAQFHAITFFNPDNSAEVFYAFNESAGEYELFDRKGAHPTYNTTLMPMTPEVVKTIEKQLKARERRDALSKTVPLPDAVPVPTMQAPTASAQAGLGTGTSYEVNSPPSGQTESVRLTVFNQSARDQDFYVEDRKIGTIPAQKSRFYTFQPGRYGVYSCMSGTTNCGGRNMVSWDSGSVSLRLP